MAWILVVDDNPTNLKLLTYVVQRSGHQVDTALDAETAQRRIRDHRPDLILLDLDLPRIDGFQLARRLKADSQTKDIVIIAVTAFAMQGDADRARAAGCDDYVTKPIDTRAFPALLDRHLDRVRTS
jgi:CheY-like chemotaxis protein